MEESLAHIETLLRALVALDLDRRERELGVTTARKIEVLLADAGLSTKEVAQISGKNYDAVRKTIQRARGAEG